MNHLSSRNSARLVTLTSRTLRMLRVSARGIDFDHVNTFNVLVEYIVSIDRDLDYANKVNKPEVWSWLAKAQLDGLHIHNSIGAAQHYTTN